MKKHLLLASLVIASFAANAQKKTTTSAVIAFDATTAIDALPKAENKTVVASLNTQTGAVAFEATMKNFAFGNPRIQDHFNQPNWLDSEKYPTATFVGKLVYPKAVNFKKNGTYNAEVEGDLTMHGVTNKVKAPVVIRFDQSPRARRTSGSV